MTLSALHSPRRLLHGSLGRLLDLGVKGRVDLKTSLKGHLSAKRPAKLSADRRAIGSTDLPRNTRCSPRRIDRIALEELSIGDVQHVGLDHGVEHDPPAIPRNPYVSTRREHGGCRHQASQQRGLPCIQIPRGHPEVVLRCRLDAIVPGLSTWLRYSSRICFFDSRLSRRQARSAS